jgi:hypothetical protein
MFFSIGGAACATMVTAILPSISESREPVSANNRPTSSSAESDVTVTQARWSQSQGSIQNSQLPWYLTSGTRLAGFVGAFTGLGALVALLCFLPLPAQFQKFQSPDTALRETYYIVGSIALAVGVICFFGLCRLEGQEDKGWHALWVQNGSEESKKSLLPYWKLFYYSIKAGLRPDIGLGYVGGFVARASSVGISLFLPLLVNHYFISTGICKNEGDYTDIRSHCREAYVLAAKLTGVSQMVALLLAPVFGYFSGMSQVLHVPLLIASISGLVGYGAFAFLVESPDPSRAGGSHLIYLWVSLLGASQIGAIVCSLGLISRGISSSTDHDEIPSQAHNHQISSEPHGLDGAIGTQQEHDPELQTLLPKKAGESQNLQHLQGSIAGTYSLGGGAAILFLTKVGGTLFDSTSVSSPFVIMFGFNLLLLISTIASAIFQLRRLKVRVDDYET